MIKIFCENDSIIEVPFDKLSGISLENLNLHRALLEKKELSKTSFKNSNLRGAFFFQAIMKECDLSSANIVLADLREANLSGANLTNSFALSTLFRNANLENANFIGANIEGSDFENANIRGTNLNCVGLENANLNNAIYDKRTIWPRNFVVKNCGAIKV